MTTQQRFPPGRFAFHVDALDRAAHLRAQPDELAALRRRADCRAYVFARDDLLVTRGKMPARALFTTEETRALGVEMTAIFLGLDNSRPRFAFAVDDGAIDPLLQRGEFEAAELRKVAAEGAVPLEELTAIATAKSLIQWHRRHRFCANCGAESTMAASGWRRDCPACGVQHFPRTDPVVIMLATRGDQCLLGRQSRFPPGMWSCLAGFLEPGETIEDAVRREVREETGIICGEVSYFASQPWPYPSSLMVGAITEALTSEIVIDHNELEDARWFDREEAIALIKRQHPDGLKAPHPFAIAYHILARWIDDTRTPG
jgi:NAD+ diphosphatase